MIAGVMRLGDRPVRAVMTPRREIEMINLSEGWEGARRQMVESVHCRFPVYEKSLEEVLGVVQVKDVLDAYLRGGRPNLPAHIRSAPVVIDTIDALDVLDIIRQSSVHMALVHDEHGHFEGNHYERRHSGSNCRRFLDRQRTCRAGCCTARR